MHSSLEKLTVKKQKMFKKLSKSKERIKNISNKWNGKDDSVFIVEYGRSKSNIAENEFGAREPTLENFSCDCYKPKIEPYFGNGGNKVTLATNSTFSRLMRRSRSRVDSHKSSKKTIFSVYDSKRASKGSLSVDYYARKIH